MVSWDCHYRHWTGKESQYGHEATLSAQTGLLFIKLSFSMVWTRIKFHDRYNPLLHPLQPITERQSLIDKLLGNAERKLTVQSRHWPPIIINQFKLHPVGKEITDPL